MAVALKTGSQFICIDINQKVYIWNVFKDYYAKDSIFQTSQSYINSQIN